MTVVGCTGHQTLTPATQRAVASALYANLRRLRDGDLEGVCSLAVGADQIFAEAILAASGRLHVIVPSSEYASTFVTEEARANYAKLLASSASNEVLPFPSPSEEAFLAAGRAVVNRSDLLYAVWDGAPAAGRGGTADIVRYARTRGRTVEIIWPEGARRT